mgnify:CR=1 FL=1
MVKRIRINRFKDLTQKSITEIEEKVRRIPDMKGLTSKTNKKHNILTKIIALQNALDEITEEDLGW